MRPSQIEALHFFNVRTVEDLAEVSDGNLGKMGAGFLELRVKAREFLQTAKDGAQANILKEELAKRDVMLAQMSEKLAALEAKSDKSKK